MNMYIIVEHFVLKKKEIHDNDANNFLILISQEKNSIIFLVLKNLDNLANRNLNVYLL